MPSNRTLGELQPLKLFELRHSLFEGVVVDSETALELVKHRNVKNLYTVAEVAYEFFDGLLLSVSLEKKGRHSYQALNIHDTNLFGERAEERSKIPNPYAGLGGLDMIEALRCELVDDFLPPITVDGYRWSSKREPYLLPVSEPRIPHNKIGERGEGLVLGLSIPAHRGFDIDLEKMVDIKVQVCVAVYLEARNELWPLIYFQPGRSQWAIAKYVSSLMYDIEQYVDGSAHYDGFNLRKIVGYWASYIMDKHSIPMTIMYKGD